MLMCVLSSWRGGTKGKAPLLRVSHQRLSGPYPQILLWIGSNGPITEMMSAAQPDGHSPVSRNSFFFANVRGTWRPSYYILWLCHVLAVISSFDEHPCHLVSDAAMQCHDKSSSKSSEIKSNQIDQGAHALISSKLSARTSTMHTNQWDSLALAAS
jgi:hypothetical protein